MKKEKKTVLTRATWLKVRLGLNDDGVIVWNRSDRLSVFYPAPLADLLAKETRLDVRHCGKIFKDCRIEQGCAFVPNQGGTYTSGDHPPQYSTSFTPAHIAWDHELYVVSAGAPPTSLFVNLVEGRIVRNSERRGYYCPAPGSADQGKGAVYLGEVEIRIVKRARPRSPSR